VGSLTAAGAPRFEICDDLIVADISADEQFLRLGCRLFQPCLLRFLCRSLSSQFELALCHYVKIVAVNIMSVCIAAKIDIYVFL
jgi:hypothetical protein